MILILILFGLSAIAKKKKKKKKKENVRKIKVPLKKVMTQEYHRHQAFGSHVNMAEQMRNDRRRTETDLAKSSDRGLSHDMCKPTTTTKTNAI